MASHRFLQFHFLTSYPATLLNRDDQGMAKRLPFGGAIRTRVSSQCLKRHWRTADGEHALAGLEGVELSVRSRRIFSDQVAAPLIAEGLPEPLVNAGVAAFQDGLLGNSARKKAKKGQEDSLETGQVVVMGPPEVRYVRDQIRALAGEVADPKELTKQLAARFKERDYKKNMKALLDQTQGAAGLDAALFGRMVTSDILSRLDAAIHVAHAFTVHGEEAETDYFSAMDDLQADDGELGSGHINDSELTSGLFYGYVVVDVAQLVGNLNGREREKWAEGDREFSAQVVERLVNLIATVSPGAKKGATAPYAYAELMLAESGARQPRTLANAFLKPAAHRGDIRASAMESLIDYLERCDKAYGRHEGRFAAGMMDMDGLPVDKFGSIEALAQWAGQCVREAS